MTIREGVGWIIGSAIAGIGAFLSWFYESGLLAAIVGIVTGAGITFFVQSRTQKRAWKREYALKNTEAIYGPLYEDIDKVLSYCGEAFHYVYSHKWREIKQTFQYLTIDEAFRKKLDDFYQRLDNYNNDTQKAMDLINNRITEESRIAFPSYGESRLQFTIRAARRGESNIDINESLRLQQHPVRLAERNKRGNEIQEYFIEFSPVKGGQIQHLHYEGENKVAFDRMWDTCHKKIEQDPLIQAVRKEYLEVTKGLQNIKKELVKRIQEPWAI